MKRVKELYKIIENAKNELEGIRSTCTHTTFKGNYMWAPGHITEGYICEECGQFLGEMKTAEEWLNEPKYWTDYYLKVLKNKLSKNKYTEELLTWEQFDKLVKYYESINESKT